VSAILALVGRPNVGKSTLFNRLTRSRDALVADVPGLTRDRHYGHGRIGERRYVVIDTGGLEAAPEGVYREMARQTELAIAEADVVLFVVDYRAGPTAQDRLLAERLRLSGRRLLVVVNKAEGIDRALAASEFHVLGLGQPLAISAAHGDGVAELVEVALEPVARDGDEPAAPPGAERPPRVAFIGRPNAGKSTLVNRLLGEERLVVFDQPGTTRDSVEVEFERGGRRYLLIDTAGVRRRSRVDDAVEKFSVVKTLAAIDSANVVVLVIDGREGAADQDAHLLGYALEAGRALVIAINKCDGLDAGQREALRRHAAARLSFADYARTVLISARTGAGIDRLLAAVDAAWRAAMIRLPTPRLTRVLYSALERQSPPRSGRIRPKLRYAHQGGVNPPLIVVHGNALDAVPASYRRYLENAFREAFRIEGTPLRIAWKQGANPFDRARRGGPA
jgi:GTP-binding protein